MIRFFILCLGILVIAGGHHAAAHDPMGDIPVTERQFNSFMPKGLKLGKVTFYPTINAESEWTSNVFLNNRDKESDTILSVKPSLSATMPVGDAIFEMNTAFERKAYAAHDSQNHNNYAGALTGRFNLGSQAALETTINLSRRHQDRFDLSSADIPDAPMAVDDKGFLAKLILKPSRLQWELSAGIGQKQYENGQSINTNTAIIQSDRARTYYQAGVETTYDTHKKWKPFFGLKYSRTDFDRRDYIQGTGFTGVNQNTQRYAAMAGLILEPMSTLRGKIQFGYGYETPDDAALDNGSTALVDIDLTYLYSPLTNFNVHASRFFSDDTDASQSIIETRLTASIIHELTRKWVFQAGIDYRMRDFQNTNEEDTTLGGFVAADYKVNDRLHLGAEIRHTSRESNRDNGDVDETRAMLRVKTAF